MKFEYLVCLIQKSRVTWVNGQWEGAIPLDSATPEEAALESCPELWEFLNRKGQDAWELVASTSEVAEGELTGWFSHDLELHAFTQLYLKRPSADSHQGEPPK